ncbi:MAG TPA: serine hydrolase domain-containing protein [Phycisphaerae bacterium]|nr:serine hydrolase domain-containing protein [Phycisphaerae bacterium]
MPGIVAEKDAEHVLLRRPKHPITIHNVLTHTSGLPFRSALEAPTLDRLPLSVCVGSYAMTPLDFEPDSRYRYSNAGINTAARIVEVVSRVPFEEFLNQRLFEPLGMKDTTFWPSQARAARIATSYKPGPGGQGLAATTIDQLRYPLTDRQGRFPVPAGGLFSTAHDVARFYRMLLNGGQLDGRRYLSESAVRQMTSRQTPTGLKESYGFGLAVGGDFFGHGGAYSTHTTAETRRGLVLVWLVQHAGFPGQGGQAQAAFRKAAIDLFAQPAAPAAGR